MGTKLILLDSLLQERIVQTVAYQHHQTPDIRKAQ